MKRFFLSVGPNKYLPTKHPTRTGFSNNLCELIALFERKFVIWKMTKSQFYDSSRNEICCTDAIGRVPLRMVGGTSLGLSIIQVASLL